MLSSVLPLLLIPPSLEVIPSLHVAHKVALSNTLLSSQLTFDSLLAASPDTHQHLARLLGQHRSSDTWTFTVTKQEVNNQLIGGRKWRRPRRRGGRRWRRR